MIYLGIYHEFWQFNTWKINGPLTDGDELPRKEWTLNMSIEASFRSFRVADLTMMTSGRYYRTLRRGTLPLSPRPIGKVCRISFPKSFSTHWLPAVLAVKLAHTASSRLIRFYQKQTPLTKPEASIPTRFDAQVQDLTQIPV
jgi:hypothetical protein